MNSATARQQPLVFDLQRNEEGVFEYRAPRRTWSPRATRALLFALAAGFALQSSVPGLTARLMVAAAPVAAGEWWRLATGAFLHGGLIHLAANAWFAWVVGSRLERTIGPARLLILALAAILGSSLAVVAGGGAAVGFSGVLYGWLAGLLGFHLTSRFPELRFDRAQGRAWLQLLAANLFVSLLPGVSLLGHLGGFVAGLAASLLLGAQPVRRGASRQS
jgi:membrane associated rhomboid family serine protease